MRKLVNLLRGTVPVRVEGAFPERLLNLCAQNRVDFWGVEWKDSCTFTCLVRRSGVKQLRRLAGRISCTVELGEGRGLPYLLGRFRHRYAFWVGLMMSLVAVFFVSGVVFTVEVSGNERVSTARILGELSRLGLRPGAYGPVLELKQISQEGLLVLDELSWMGINLYGTRAEVTVREVKQPPKVRDETGHYHVVAETDGIVTEIDPYVGEGMVKEGDTVAAGDVLISGTVSMKPPKYSDHPVRYFQTHAHGTVWATTFRTLTAKIPLTADTKVYTGETMTRHTLFIFGQPIEFYQNSSISWPLYDKINTVYPVVLPGEVALPVRWQVQTLRAYELQSTQLDWQAAQAMLEGRLGEQLKWLVGEEGQVLSTQYSAVVRDGWLTVKLQAQCTEEIGREIPAETGKWGGASP